MHRIPITLQGILYPTVMSQQDPPNFGGSWPIGNLIHTLGNLLREDIMQPDTWRNFSLDLLSSYSDAAELMDSTFSRKKYLCWTTYIETQNLIREGKIDMDDHQPDEEGYCYTCIFGPDPSEPALLERKAACFILGKNPLWVEFKHLTDFIVCKPRHLVVELTSVDGQAHFAICNNPDEPPSGADPNFCTIGDIFTLLESNPYSIQPVGGLDPTPNDSPKGVLKNLSTDKDILIAIFDKVVVELTNMRFGQQHPSPDSDGYCYLKAYGDNLCRGAMIELLALVTVLGSYPTLKSLSILIPRLIYIDRMSQYDVTVTGKILHIKRKKDQNFAASSMPVQKRLGGLYEGFAKAYKDQNLLIGGSTKNVYFTNC